MENKELLSTLADHYFPGTLERAKKGDREAAKELISIMKDRLIQYAARTPGEIFDQGFTFIDIEMAEFLYDVMLQVVDGESADHALFIKQKDRKRPFKPRSEDFKDIALAKTVHSHIKTGLSQNKAAERTADEYDWASDSRIKSAYRKYKKYLC